MPVEHSILVDGHVHIYDCFDLPRFLDSAYVNFRAQVEKMQEDPTVIGVLLLSESFGCNWFEWLAHGAPRSGKPTSAGRWQVDRTGEDCSLILRRDDDAEMLLLAGRQITTQEDLEVLALCTASQFRDNWSLDATVESVRDAGGIPVVPWGTGKWLGSRGALLSRFLRSQDPGAIFLGDNSARPVFWRNPSHFKRARARGIRILPGTDPLPFASEVWRPGSFGFVVRTSLDPEHPAQSLKEILRHPGTVLEPYGALEKPWRFFRNQIAMQVRKRV